MAEARRQLVVVAGRSQHPTLQHCPSFREQEADQPAVHGMVLQRLTDPSLGVTGPLGILQFPSQM